MKPIFNFRYDKDQFFLSEQEEKLLAEAFRKRLNNESKGMFLGEEEANTDTIKVKILSCNDQMIASILILNGGNTPPRRYLTVKVIIKNMKIITIDPEKRESEITEVENAIAKAKDLIKQVHYSLIYELLTNNPEIHRYCQVNNGFWMEDKDANILDYKEAEYDKEAVFPEAIKIENLGDDYAHFGIFWTPFAAIVHNNQLRIIT